MSSWSCVGGRDREAIPLVAVAWNRLMGGAAVGTPKAVGRVGFHSSLCLIGAVGHRPGTKSEGLSPTQRSADFPLCTLQSLGHNLGLQGPEKEQNLGGGAECSCRSRRLGRKFVLVGQRAEQGWGEGLGRQVSPFLPPLWSGWPSVPRAPPASGANGQTSQF